MGYAMFNQCTPCCECQIGVSAIAGTGIIPGVTIEVRDVNGSGVGSCITTSSGCTIPINNPGTYFVYNDWCGTTQRVNIDYCGSTVSVNIPSSTSRFSCFSSCFADVPLTRFTLNGPKGFSFVGTASGNTTAGSPPAVQRGALVTVGGNLPSGTYTLMVEDVDGNHWPNNYTFSMNCAGITLNNTFMRKKWGYGCSPYLITAGGCVAPGITVSDSDGHSATTDANGITNQKWKYDFPDEDPTDANSYTYIKVQKDPYVWNGFPPEGNKVAKPRCSPEPSSCVPSPPILASYNLSFPPGFWGCPTDDCIEEQPQTLNVSFSGFTVPVGNPGGGTTQYSSMTAERGRCSNTVGFNNYGAAAPNALPTNCSVFLTINPRCKKTDLGGDTGNLFNNISIPSTNGGGPFPAGIVGFNIFGVKLFGTAACPTLMTFVEYNVNTGDLTGRSVTVSA